MKPKQKILFEEDLLPYEVKAINERFAVCTREINKRNDHDLLRFEVERGAYASIDDAWEGNKKEVVYTIIDFEKNIRGTENLLFCMGFKTIKLCKEALERLTSGETEISRRNQVGLNIKIVYD